ncbi:hypothetical protein CDD81_3053 [Ophiocordyceps australis]|uniref:C3H1-type domain-containing protein n=1 Tax=Ophiocordyceps australis TaxID=1399860 RepID=A0A2C5YJV0_9HYPO|nr:hypothetical protein CDD81_3053 [Ophiocordyceps australis]
MSVEISLNTPLADALNTAIKPKLVEVGWGTGGSDDSALAEYVILMLVNGKTQDQIAAELSGELLSLPADDPGVHDFSKWLFEQIDRLSRQVKTDGETLPDQAQEARNSADVDTEMTSNDVSELNVPTGPRSMRNNNVRGARDRRILGHMNKAMDRSGDAPLHRTRGNDRINTHGRPLPMGPRAGLGRAQRNSNNNLNNNNFRAASLQAGLGASSGPPGPSWNVYGPQPNQMELMAILEQQNQMMLQLSQQLMNGGAPSAPNGFGQRRGKSLFERVSDPQQRNNLRKGGTGNHHSHTNSNIKAANKDAAEAESDDIEMADSKHEPLKAEETVCKFNLNCTNKECKYAHQSPAAAAGISIDVNDTCSFGAACKNKKCVGRHPSPATKLAHQGEQDCKFFPNCQNPRCPFRHPSMPLCRNGPGCTTANCKFTHVKTKCKFSPCLNPHCVFAHEEGQQGSFRDKVWTAEAEEHVSERKFVDEGAAPERVRPGEGEEAMATTREQAAEVSG